MLERDFINGIIATGAERWTDGDIKEYIYNHPIERLESLSISIHERQGALLSESLFGEGKNDYFNLDWRNQFDRLGFAVNLIKERMEEHKENGQKDAMLNNSELDKECNNRQRGRPVVPFKDSMILDEDGRKLQALHSVMKGRKGKRAALVMLCAKKLGWIDEVTARSVTNEFGNIGNESGFQRYYSNPNAYREDEFSGMCRALEEEIQKN